VLAKIYKLFKQNLHKDSTKQPTCTFFLRHMKKLILAKRGQKNLGIYTRPYSLELSSSFGNTVSDEGVNLVCCRCVTSRALALRDILGSQSLEFFFIILSSTQYYPLKLLMNSNC